MAADSDHENSLADVITILLEEKTALDTPDAPSVDLAAESDVKLWLQHTGFFDVEHRQKILDALRQLKALDEQRQKILSEIHRATPYIVPPSTPIPSQSHSVYSPSLYSAQRPSPLALDRLGDYANLSRYHAEATQSAGELCGSEPSLVNKGADSESGYSANGSLSSQQNDVPIPDASVKQAQRSGDDADLDDQEEPSPSKKSSAIEISVDEVALPSTPTQGILTPTPKYLKQSSLTKSIEARYFLVKSFNSMNVEMSQRDVSTLILLTHPYLYATNTFIRDYGLQKLTMVPC
jgi:hypothetical protein